MSSAMRFDHSAAIALDPVEVTPPPLPETPPRCTSYGMLIADSSS